MNARVTRLIFAFPVLLGFLASQFFAPQSIAAETAAKAKTVARKETLPPAVLTLQNGQFVRGRLLGISEARLTWESDFFSDPLVFPIKSVTGIRVQPKKDVESKEEFVVEFANSRDRVLGKLISINEEQIQIQSADFGKFSLRRSAVQRISRNGVENQLYPVPTRLDDWKQSEENTWQSTGQTISSDKVGARLFADVKLPAKAIIEFELAWAGTPKFGIHFGTTSDEESLKNAFSIEVWGDNIVAQGRTDKVADVVQIQSVKAAASSKVNSLNLLAYLDRDLGEMIVTDSSGKELGRIKTKEGDDSPPTGITLVNWKRLQIKQLRVRGWSGASPSNASTDMVLVALKDREVGGNEIQISDGKVQLQQSKEKEKEAVETVIEFDKVQSISFRTDNAPTEQQAVLSWRNGNRISGDIVAANQTHLTVKSAAFSDSVQLPLTDLKGLWYPPAAGVMASKNDTGSSYADWYAERQAAKTKATSAASATKKPLFKHRKGTLELMDTRLTGWLVKEKTTDKSKVTDESASCLVWQPQEALNASSILKQVYGRIIYVKPPRTATTTKPKNSNTVGMFGGMFVNGNPRTKAKTRSRSKTLAGTSVHLRSGDTIPCKVVSIDERGVHIESDLTETKSLPHSEVKAAQLTKSVALPMLEKKKRQRLLTLPRMHRDIPPQHLLFSKKGDVLRGSVVTMGDEQVNLEVRLDQRKVPRDRVSAIVWLHENELTENSDDKNKPKDEQKDAASNENKEIEDEKNDELMVQVIGKTNSRFTFAAKTFNNDTVFGTSEILKDVHAKVDQMNQLLLGDFIQRSARTLPYHRWRLTSARDPAFVTAGDEDSQETLPGTESGLVGATAPEIKLVFLDGKKFNLSNYRGQTVVLDFWASWCGPCLQVMPVIDEVVSEFDDSKVKLFAVNLEETAEQVKATLERRKLDVTVVLDRDGVAAARYEANAIPQTVVIGPDGKVTRVFVGGSKKLADQLRTAISEVTSDE